METRRRDARTGLVRTASTETGLADVVRSARKLSGKPLVWQVDCKVAARLARCEPIAREESFPARPATLPSRNVLSLSFHDVARTARDRRVVETRATSGIFAHGFSGSGASALKLARWRIYSPAMAKEGPDRDRRHGNASVAGHDVPRRSSRPTQCACTYRRQDAEAFH